ncbi:MAG: hydrogenase maturation protease [Acidobacteriia bacterium]|nr:hydrogenase maturation protease [Terriglobia bacterium]
MMRIIGCGNPDRADDAAGILVARRLRELGLDSMEHSGDGFALLDLWQGADDVVLVDAMLSGAPPGTITVWDPASQPAGAPGYCCSTHAFGPAEAIELGRALGRLPSRIRVYGIEASGFDTGGAPRAEVLDAVDRVVNELSRYRGLAPLGTAATMSGSEVG